MKKSVSILVATATLVMQSCSSSQKVTINAKPGTTIISPDLHKLGTVPETGTLKVKLTKDAYYGYMIATDPTGNEAIPFGINTSAGNKSAERGEGWALVPAIGGGIVAIIGGCLMKAEGENSDSPVGGAMLGIGTGVFLEGIIQGALSSASSGKIAYANQFKYLPNQTAIQNIPLSQALLNPEPPKSSPETLIQTPVRKKATSGEANKSTRTPADNRKAPASSSQKTLDYAKMVDGTYSCHGELRLNHQRIESYNDVVLIIERTDKNQVAVRVIESNEDFFAEPGIYNVAKVGKNKYVLTMADVPSATITVSTNGSVEYKHDKVNIDDENYTLLLKK